MDLYENATVTILNSHDIELKTILAPQERLIWTGQASYGRRFFEPVGSERSIHIVTCISIAALWIAWLITGRGVMVNQISALEAVVAATAFLVLLSAGLAAQRQYSLRKLIYFLTDTRAIVCCRKRNWRLQKYLMVVSCPCSKDFPYSVISSRPKPSLLVGVLPLKDIYSLGSARHTLTHAGQPSTSLVQQGLVEFEYIDNAQEVLEMIQACSQKPRRKPLN